MKKLLLLMAMVLCMASANAQRVITDKAEKNGSRYIRTMSVKFSIYDTSVYLDYNKMSSGNQRYTLGIVVYSVISPERIRTGRKLLLKFEDGSIMELSNRVNIGELDYDYTIASYGDVEYYVVPHYTVTTKQINDIISKKVIKVRIETDSGNEDYNVKDNMFSDAIKEMYDNIKEALTKENNVYTGF